MVDTAEFAGDGGLASAGVASENTVVDLFLAVVESSAAALLEEACLVGHGLYALFHIVETDHLTQFTHALLKRRTLAGEHVEGDVLFLQLRRLVIFHEGNGALKEPRSNLFGYEAADVFSRPVSECSLFPTQKNGVGKTVFRRGAGCEVADKKLAVKGLHEVEGRIGFLFDHALTVKEASQRGEELQQLVCLLS